MLESGQKDKIGKRLHYLERSIDEVVEAVRPLMLTPELDVCFVKKLSQDMDTLSKRLVDVIDDILSLTTDDVDLMNMASSMEKTRPI